MPTAVARSSTRRQRACSSAVIAVASAAARYPIADCSISSASSALPGDTTLLIAVCHLLPMLADWRTGSFPRVIRRRVRLFNVWSDSTLGGGHFHGIWTDRRMLNEKD